MGVWQKWLSTSARWMEHSLGVSCTTTKKWPNLFFSINEMSFYRFLIGNIPGFLVPKMMGIFGTDTRQQWLVIFTIAAVVIFACFIFFAFAIDDNEEKYDEEIHHDPNVDDTASAIKDVVTDGEDPLDPEILVVIT